MPESGRPARTSTAASAARLPQRGVRIPDKGATSLLHKKAASPAQTCDHSDSRFNLPVCHKLQSQSIQMKYHFRFFTHIDIRHIIMPFIMYIFICMALNWFIAVSPFAYSYSSTRILTYEAYFTLHHTICQVLIRLTDGF